MTACAQVVETLAEFDRQWWPVVPGGDLVPVCDKGRAVRTALGAANVLEDHGWHHRRFVKINNLRTMLVFEQRIPSHG